MSQLPPSKHVSTNHSDTNPFAHTTKEYPALFAMFKVDRMLESFNSGIHLLQSKNTPKFPLFKRTSVQFQLGPTAPSHFGLTRQCLTHIERITAVLTPHTIISFKWPTGCLIIWIHRIIFNRLNDFSVRRTPFPFQLNNYPNFFNSFSALDNPSNWIPISDYPRSSNPIYQARFPKYNSWWNRSTPRSRSIIIAIEAIISRLQTVRANLIDWYWYIWSRFHFRISICWWNNVFSRRSLAQHGNGPFRILAGPK